MGFMIERVFPAFTIMMIFAALGFIVFMWVKMIRQKHSDSRAPEETANGLIATKRMQIGRTNDTAYTNYFVTVEFEDGSRKELKAKGELYGLLAEGDRGAATFKGSTLVSFCRTGSAAQNSDGRHKCSGCGAVFRGEVCDYCGTPWTADN